MCDPVSRANHTVPKFYLRGFAYDQGFVGVVRRPGHTRYRQDVAKVSVINDFYTVDGAAQRDVIEKLIADEIEAPAVQLFRKVLIDQVWPLSKEERVILARVFAFATRAGIKSAPGA